MASGRPQDLAPGNEAEWARINREEHFSDGKVLAAGDIENANHFRVDSRHGVIDIMRGGLRSVGFKRLANRGQDRLDLEALEQVNGKLPIDPIPASTAEYFDVKPLRSLLA